MRWLAVATALATVSAGAACAAPHARHNDGMDRPSARTNAELFRRYGDIWASGRIDQLSAIIGPGYVGHSSAGDRDAAGLADRIRKFSEVYADVTFTVLDQVAEGDRVASRMRITAKVRATGQPVVLIGLNISRFSNGRIVEEWPVCETMKKGGK